jgi:integrase
VVEKAIALPPVEVLKKLGGRMPRYRFQRGYVKERGKRVKKWVGFYRVYFLDADGGEHSRRTSMILGLKSELRKSEAEAKLAIHLSQQAGHVPVKPDMNALFEWFWTERYLPTKEGHWSENQRVTIKGLFNKHVLPVIGTRKLCDLNKFDIQTLLNRLAKSHSESVIDKISTYLRASLEEAVDQEFIGRNPCRRVDLPKTKKPTKRNLSKEEIQKMLGGLKDFKDRLIFHCFLTLALRPGELFALRWRDIQAGRVIIDEAVYRNRLGDPKTPSSVAPVALPPHLELMLNMWKASLKRNSPDDFVFESRWHYRPMDSRSYLRRVLKPLAKELGVRGLTFQALRRTFATQSQTLGTVKDTQAQMRHAHPDLTADLYQQAIPENTRRMVEELEKKLLLPVTGGKVN